MLIQDFSRHLTEIKSDLVVVGSTALFVRGLIDRLPNDLDVNVKDFSGLEPFEITEYVTTSPFSVSGRRGFSSSQQLAYKLDIFAEDERPASEIIDGIRVISRESAIKYLERLIPAVRPYFKDSLINQLKLYYE
jgi:hypothetical protein